MSTSLGDTKQLDAFRTLLSTSGNIVLTCHLSPDGDALGSTLGLRCVLARLNPAARVNVVTPDEPTRNLAFLPRYDDIIAYSSQPARVKGLLSHADLIVCLDFNDLSRTDLVAPFIEKSRAAKVLVDHHLEPSDFADITFSEPEKCSTCMLLFEVLAHAGLEHCIDDDAANCLLAGMMTDTGDFSYGVSDPAIYTVIGRLIALGADKGRLTHLLFNTFSESNLRIQGFALSERMEVFADMHAALVVLSRADLNARDYHKGDTEGLVNKPLSIPGVLYSCYLREETDYIKVSMRSLGDFPVNELCKTYFGGGGHRNAAGGEFRGSMEECVETFKSILAENKRKYIETSAENNRILSIEAVMRQ